MTGGCVACLVLALMGAMPWGPALLLAALGVVLPLASAALGAFLAVHTQTLSETIFRITLALLGPPVAMVLLATLGLTQPIYHAVSPLTAIPGGVLTAGDPGWVTSGCVALGVYAAAGCLGALYVSATLRKRVGALVKDW
ncbi:MAG TPA: hypothetical protein VK689_07595, partial [Armatimonadota bacterium]|nr:hypothetical protein [Armatimonadota bacterium]